MTRVPVELNLARHVSERFKLKPPVIQLLDIAKQFANVEMGDLPIDVDGASLDLKRPGVRPTIFINTNKNDRRQQFTLAHELGHVLIPTHYGDVVDEQININDSYSPIEAEANRFASELLLPAAWGRQFLNTVDDPSALLTYLAKRAKVSLACAAYKLPEILGPGYVFAELTPEYKVKSAISTAPRVVPPVRGSRLNYPDQQYAASENFWVFERPDDKNIYCWWQLPGAAPLMKSVLTASDVMGVILNDCKIPERDRTSFLGSIGGICGSRVKRDKPVEDGIKRLRLAFEEKAKPGYCNDKNRSYYQKVLKHPRLSEFIELKVPELIEKAYWLDNTKFDA